MSKYREEDLAAIRYLFESEPEKNWSQQKIAEVLGYRGRRLPVLRSALGKLQRQGVLVEIRKQTYSLGQAADLVSGKLSLSRGGVGFVVGATGETIRIESEDTGVALPGDTVMVRKSVTTERATGKIIRVVEQHRRDIVGTLSSTGRFMYVTPLDPIYQRDIVVSDAAGAREGDRVVVRIQDWANRQVAPEGEIIDVIGPADNPSLDTKVIMRQYNLPEKFPAAATRAAEEVSALLEVPGERRDLRKNTFVLTVDPATARDYDDALSLSKDRQGRRVLGVHIADVSHFVQQGSALDEEAAERGTSVYLVDKVVPMLPEQLSNGVCSLRPGEDRLCFSAFLTFDEQGVMVARRFAKTIIRSRLRLDYGEALALIEGEKMERKIPAAAVRLVREVSGLAQQMREIRMGAGALNLDVPEVEIELGEDARMTGVSVRESDVSHQMIEECMVAANEAVAAELLSRKQPIISRLHEPPDPLRMEELSGALADIGIVTGDLTKARNLKRFLEGTEEHPLRDMLHTMVLRSMKRAVYSSEATGHFGLSKKYYAHFTAPIRRYPDLVLHRQLADFLAQRSRKSKAERSYLAGVALKATESEQNADDAARALIEIKKYRFLQQQLDEGKAITYDAVISRVTNYGLFVDISIMQLGGLVRISTISENFVRYERGTETLVGDGKRYQLGGRVSVRVVRVDFDQRHVDFELVQPQSDSSDKRKKKRSNRKKR